MAVASTPKELEHRMMMILEHSMDKVSKEVAEDIKDEIQKQVYDKYTPSSNSYKRTNQLKNSVAVTYKRIIGNNIKTEVGHNVDNMRYYSVNGKDNGELSKNIPEIIQRGRIGAIHRKGLWKNQSYHQPQIHTFAISRPYMANVRKQLENGGFKKKMVANLRGKGLTIG